MLIFHRQQTTEGQQPRRRMGCFGKALIGLLIWIAFCAIYGAWIGDMMSVPETKLEDNTVYRLKMEGVVVEQAPMDNPFESMLSDMPGYSMEQKVGLDDLISNIRLAKTDDRIKGIYLEGGNFSIGPASATALHNALLDFKTSGKFVVAYSAHYSELCYYIASAADRICLNPIGMVEWHGLGGVKMYYTRLLDKLGVKMQIFKVGTFKSAVEPFFRTSMSAEDRVQTMRYLQGIWDGMVQDVAYSRDLTVEQLNTYADEYMGLQAQDKYLTYHLVDTLVYQQSMDTILRELMGTKDYHRLTTTQMAHVKRVTKQDIKDKVAVIYAEGEITDEEGEGIVGKKMLKTFDKVLRDDDIKAVVLRVNSPGGSADASEQICHAVTLLRQKGLPVVVSMGDYAASGGYYISCMADCIFAQPNTLTGSIGIFGMMPNAGPLMNKIGVDVDVVGTNRHTSMGASTFRGMNSEESALMQQMVERGYDLFTSRCAEGRHMSQDSIKAIAEGRVWTGSDALHLGLVDVLGGLDDAINMAADLAGIEHYTMTYYPEKKDVMEELLKAFDHSTDEERMMAKLKTLVAQPSIMALAPVVTIK